MTLQKAYILHQRPYKNTSAIIEVFTPEYGHLSLVARGSRRTNSKIKGLLQPLTPLLISWFGRGDLLTLKQVEADGSPLFCQGRALYSVLYLNELLIRLLHSHDAHPALFYYYQQTLAEISTVEPLEACLRYFEVNLLAEIGYALCLDVDIDGQMIEKTGCYRFISELGFKRVLAIKNQRIDHFSGKTLLAIQAKNLAHTDELREAKRLLRLVLQPHIGKPLNSRRLFTLLKPDESLQS